MEPIDYQKWLAGRISLAREMRGLKQTQIARLLSIAQSTYSNWETGSAVIPAVTLLELARVTGVPATFFLPETTAASLADALLHRYPDVEPATIREIEEFASWAVFRDRQRRSENTTPSDETSDADIASSSESESPSA